MTFAWSTSALGPHCCFSLFFLRNERKWESAKAHYKHQKQTHRERERSHLLVLFGGSPFHVISFVSSVSLSLCVLMGSSRSRDAQTRGRLDLSHYTSLSYYRIFFICPPRVEFACAAAGSRFAPCFRLLMSFFFWNVFFLFCYFLALSSHLSLTRQLADLSSLCYTISITIIMRLRAVKHQQRERYNEAVRQLPRAVAAIIFCSLSTVILIFQDSSALYLGEYYVTHCYGVRLRAVWLDSKLFFFFIKLKSTVDIHSHKLIKTCAV